MSGLLKYFKKFHGYQPTEDQSYFMMAFEKFMASNKPNCAVILNGYAGTGKTTLLAACANYLTSERKKYVLMAPTGRAAKVLSSYSKKKAYTIHKVIYALKKRKGGGQFFALKKNSYKDTVFIVDECSMIGEEGGGFTKNSLLDDLMSFVFSGTGCRLVLVGDEAQLPPVGAENSPALNKDRLEMDFNLTIAKITLNQVVRQELQSGILLEATRLREQMQNPDPFFKLEMHHDVQYLSRFDFTDHYQEHLDKYGDDAVMYITRSNKQANRLNQQIRTQVYHSESMIDGGDKLMVVKNNYHWVQDDSTQDFIANGDFCVIQRVRNQDEIFGFNFTDATLYFSDYNLELDVKIWLDSLFVDQASMPQAQGEKLWDLIDKEFYGDIINKPERKEALKKDPYLQALQVKFGHAVTCHKAQGGQWPVVYIDVGYLPNPEMDLSFLRWLYTAFTRASEKVFLVNFPEEWVAHEPD
ncbi:AAA family ATPase [Luteibaculum oceani]|uniref:AAA family ATPase n=2 Tax=Luteibaculum oceani TaxID=1294296 RepID=A0A5C6VBF4_9FLAO|nr:AAA family ATPase [Luteibaculum oceani]